MDKQYQQVALYNLIPSMLWTILFLFPVAFYCYGYMPVKTVYMLTAVSFIPYLFPSILFDKIQLSRNSRLYKKIGVQYVNRFAQGGTIINSIIRKKYPEFKIVKGTPASMKKQYRQTYFFEKFHWCLFLFYTMITVHAVLHKNTGWMIYLIVANVVYNIYPNLLQQYIRVKLKPLMDRTGSA